MFFLKKLVNVFTAFALIASFSVNSFAQTSVPETFNILQANINSAKESIEIPSGSEIRISVYKAQVPGWGQTRWKASSSGYLSCTEWTHSSGTHDYWDCFAEKAGTVTVQAFNGNNEKQQSNALAITIFQATEGEFTSCINPPDNHTPSTCIDKFQNGAWDRNASFSCLEGYGKQGKLCVKGGSNYQKSFQLKSAGFSSNTTAPTGELSIQWEDPLRYASYFLLNYYRYTPGVKSIEEEITGIKINGSERKYTFTARANKDYQIKMTAYNANGNEIESSQINASTQNGYIGSETSCTSPYVLYQGECVDPIPGCANPPKYSVPTSCIDKIENGVKIGNYNFKCQEGYEKIGKECISQEPIDVSHKVITQPVPKSNPGQISTPEAGYEDKVITNHVEFSHRFSDTLEGTLQATAASELHRRAVIGGFPDGEFKGGLATNRAEAAKFLLRAKGRTSFEGKNNSRFPDMKEGEWYVPYIMAAVEEGLMAGDPRGLARPGDTVIVAEFLKMLAKNFGLEENLPHKFTVEAGVWFEPYLGLIDEYDLFPNKGEVIPWNNMTREDVAIAIYQYLKNRGIPNSNTGDTYTNSKFGVSFKMEKNWKITNETNERITVSIEDYDIEIGIYTKPANETFTSWIDRVVKSKLFSPFKERECDIDKTTQYAKIAYCDWGGAVRYVMNKEETRIVEINLGQDWPEETNDFQDRIRFKD